MAIGFPQRGMSIENSPKGTGETCKAYFVLASEILEGLFQGICMAYSHTWQIQGKENEQPGGELVK